MKKLFALSFVALSTLITPQLVHADVSCKIKLRGKWITADFNKDHIKINFSEVRGKNWKDTTRPTTVTGGKCPIFYKWNKGAWEFCTNKSVRRVDNLKVVGKHKCNLGNVLKES